MGPSDRSEPPLKGRWDPEQDPLADLVAGETRTFEAFVRDQAPPLRAFFRRLGAPVSEADDLVQDTFVKLYRHAPSYQPIGRFLPFAFRIARNVWIDRQRRRSHRPFDDPRQRAGHVASEGEDRLGNLSAGTAEPHVAVTSEEEVVRLTSALAELPETHRLVFELGVLQELPYADISEALDIPVGTVKSRMFYAVRRLRLVWESEAGDGPRPDEEGVA